LQEEPNLSNLTTQLLNCVRGGKSRDLKKIFSRPDYHGREYLIAGSDINLAHTVFQFFLPHIAWAAIESGVNELTAATVYLDYRKKELEVNSGQKLQNLLRASLVEYADMVAALQKEKLPPLAQRCREYIAGHLYDSINVNHIARKLRVSRSYLSHAYRAACGETIIGRIRKEKTTAAEVLLAYSRLSLVEIALQLGFSSQSHFTQVFNKEKGMTPHQYREAKKAQI
jgi:AraC-like DNA-binding protein